MVHNLSLQTYLWLSEVLDSMSQVKVSLISGSPKLHETKVLGPIHSGKCKTLLYPLFYFTSNWLLHSSFIYMHAYEKDVCYHLFLALSRLQNIWLTTLSYCNKWLFNNNLCGIDDDGCFHHCRRQNQQRKNNVAIFNIEWVFGPVAFWFV